MQLYWEGANYNHFLSLFLLESLCQAAGLAGGVWMRKGEIGGLPSLPIAGTAAVAAVLQLSLPYVHSWTGGIPVIIYSLIFTMAHFFCAMFQVTTRLLVQFSLESRCYFPVYISSRS